MIHGVWGSWVPCGSSVSTSTCEKFRVVGLLVGHVKKEITNGSCNQAIIVMNDPICDVECTKAQIVMNLQYNTPDLLTMNN